MTTMQDYQQERDDPQLADGSHPLPKVTAVMAAHNAANTIESAIDSILWQTFTDWELVVVDDQSDDGTHEIASSIEDSRIRVVRAASRLGRGKARNFALEVSRGTYLAVADADDISMPNRFQRQVEFLDKHQALSVVGAQMAYFGKWGGPSVEVRYPVSTVEYNRRLTRRKMPLPHAAAMFRASAVREKGGYDTECTRCQDFELVLRMGADSGAVIDEVLLYYRSARQPPLRYFLENARFHRFAVARATAKCGGEEPPSLGEFENSRSRPVDLANDVARWSLLSLAAPLRRGRSLV